MAILFEPGQLPRQDIIDAIGEQVAYIGSGHTLIDTFNEWCWITRRHPETIMPGTRVAIGIKTPYGPIYDPDDPTLELAGVARVVGTVIAVSARAARVEFDPRNPAYEAPYNIKAATWVVPVEHAPTTPHPAPINLYEEIVRRALADEPTLTFSRRPKLWDVLSGKKSK